MKLKISFLLPNSGLGGGVRAIMRFGNELINRGHNVRIFYRDEVGGFKGRLKRTCRRLRYGLSYDWLSDFNGKSLKYQRLAPSDFETDEIIVSMCTRTTLDAWELPKDTGIKVLYCHGSEIENWGQMLKSWELPMPKLVVSSHLIDMIRKETGQEVLGIVPDGVDINEYFPCLPEKERIGIGAGFRWGHTKDPTSTLKVFQILKKKMPEVPLYSFGSSKKPRELNQTIYHHQPTIEQMRKIYSSCRVWFLASIKEGFGMTILEAMASGCVVVSTDCGGPRDIIEDGVNGFLVEVGNVGALAHKIKLLYKDEKLRKQICTNAAKTVPAYSWTNSVDKLERYLISIYSDECHSNSVHRNLL